VILFIYAFVASVLPVQKLLQPRDYINAHQLFVAFALIGLGLIVAHPTIVAPAYVASPKGAPSIVPFLFVVIACGAISGFHSLVSSGTSAKQLDKESDSLFVGYGSMLLEGTLAVLVIAACVAGLGLGLTTKDGQTLTGLAAYTHQYADWASANGLGAKLGAFVTGAANMIQSYGIPQTIAVTIMGVFIVSFAATTLDTATRIQRYVVSELTRDIGLPALSGRYTATVIAVLSAMVLAFYSGDGTGAMVLWPLFGTVNQLLAGLALLIITAYLKRAAKPIAYTLVPMVFMVLMTGWAMILNIHNFYQTSKWLLFVVGLIVFILEIWMIIESARIIAGGAAEEPMLGEATD